MTAPTPAQLALLRSSFPARRVAPALSSSSKPTFSSLLQTASNRTTASLPQTAAGHTTASLPQTAAGRTAAAPPRVAPQLAKKSVAAPDPQFFTAPGAGPAPVSRSEILHNADQLLDVPYVWGGTSPTGLDCSAFVSRAWGVSRQTTDTLASVARPISKDELQAGDALNLTTARDADGAGHVRLFDKWADPEHTKMWVYEETPPRSVHHVINWDPAYQPMRRLNVTDA